MDYGSGDIRDYISIAIDSLDNDNKLHIGFIVVGSYYICLAQKYTISNYAAGLVFGYNRDKLYFQIKYNGLWSNVREL